MTNIVSLSRPHDPAWDEAAEYLRELADRFERGDISECVIVLNDKEGAHFERWGHFEDRWRLLGALRYAETVAY